VGIELEPTGSAVIIKFFNSELAIVAKTNREDFNALIESKPVFKIQIKELIKKEDTSSSSMATIKFGESEAKTDLKGSFETSYKVYDKLEQDDASGKFSKMENDVDGMKRVEVSEQEANESVVLENAVITLDEGLTNKDFGRTMAHEFGHASYAEKNKAASFFYKGDPELKGHDKVNPSGEAAVKAEKTFNENYKKAKKDKDE
jgi:hypothetical protein